MKKTSKTAVALVLLAGAANAAAADQSRAQDLAGSAMATVSVNTSLASDGFSNSATEAAMLSGPTKKSGSLNPPVPQPGTLAMLIAGLGMIGFAARRRSVAI